MTKLPLLSASELEKIALRLGFVKVRQRGSHARYKHPDGRATVIPHHSGEDIGPGLLQKILDDLKLSRVEFIQVYRQL